MMNIELRDYLVFYNGVKKFKDNTSVRDIALMHDLGMYGDEIDLDLFTFIEKELDIRIVELEAVLGCHIMDYFRPEFVPWWSIFKRSEVEKMENYPRFTIGMLEDTIDEVLKNRNNH